MAVGQSIDGRLGCNPVAALESRGEAGPRGGHVCSDGVGRRRWLVRHAILPRDGRGRVDGESRVRRSRGGCRRAPAIAVESWGQAGPRGGHVHGDGVGRRWWLGRPAGAPFSGGMDVKASVANHGPGGAVEDGGRLRTMWPVTTW
jgi:hypothetical protein